MKPPFPNRLFFLLALLSYFILQPPSFSGMPQPMVVYYGQAKDGFGWPYRQNADVILLHGTNEIARHTIAGSLAPGVNFALDVPIDDGRDTTSYVRNALRTGEVVSIIVRDTYGQQTIMESNAVPAVAEPGDFILINVTAGTDTVGDGIPDEWKYELIAMSDGALTSLWDVVGSDDFDQDGQTNEEEYYAGTFAWLDYDFFYIEQFPPAAGDRLRLTFLSVPGKVYRIFAAPLAIEGTDFDWTDCEYALTETGPLELGPAEGDGNWLSFCVPLSPTNRVLRLTVE